jgi:acyl dehydratase
MADTTVEPTSGPLYLDDLRVGRRFTSGMHALDERQITAFASEFDPQPFHIDREAAKRTLFRGLVASGWHTAAITMRLQVDGGLPIAGGLIGLGGEVAWPTATRPGDVLHVESEVVEVVPNVPAFAAAMSRDLPTEALEEGDEPLGSVIVAADGLGRRAAHRGRPGELAKDAG